MVSSRSLAHSAAQLRHVPARNRYLAAVLEPHDRSAVELGTDLNRPGEVDEVLTMDAQEPVRR